MTQKAVRFTRASIGLFLLVSSVESTWCQSFSSRNGDLLAGFRKTGSHQANFEVVVNVGSITNLEALSPGSQVAVDHFVPKQLSDAFSDYNNLQWSVSGAFPGAAKWASFPSSTLWFTVPRTTSNSQSQPPLRIAAGGQQQTRQAMISVAVGAAAISANLGASNLNNTSFLVREPINDPNDLSSFVGDALTPSVGNFQSTLPFPVENTTPANFNSATVSDLYQSCPSGTTDPVTGLTSGAAYWVGYFTLNPDGTMNFTRASTNSVPSTPTSATLSIARSEGTSVISFTTTNGATYTLHFTNSAGLMAPISAWTTLTGTITGDGSIKSIADSSVDADRVYRLSAH